MTMPPSPWEWEIDLPKDGPVAEAAQQFAVHNMLLGAEILRDAARQAVVQAARQRGWPAEEGEPAYTMLEQMDDSLALVAGYMYAEGLPDKIRYRYDELVAGEMESDCWVVSKFLEQLANLDGVFQRRP